MIFIIKINKIGQFRTIQKNGKGLKNKIFDGRGEENEEEKNKRVKLNLREYIKQRGFKIKDVAKFLGTSERNFRRILQFEQPLPPSKAMILLKKGFPLTIIFPHLDEGCRRLIELLNLKREN